MAIAVGLESSPGKTRRSGPWRLCLLVLISLVGAPDPGVGQQICPAPPAVPDCTQREFVRTVYSGGKDVQEDSANPFQCTTRGFPATWDVRLWTGDEPRPLNADEEAFFEFEFSDCCGECCPDGCGFGQTCDTWIGLGAEWSIQDQRRTQLNWDNVGVGGGTASGFHTDTMWDRGNAGICGNPDRLVVEGTAANIACWKAKANVFRRTGWNMAGADPSSAPFLEPWSQWCGSINEAPCGGGSGGGYALECRPEGITCSTDHHWRAELAQGDKVHVAIRLRSGVYGGTFVSLFLHDLLGNSVATVGSWYVGSATVEQRVTYVHQQGRGIYTLSLNAHHPTSPDVKMSDLWEYGVGFAIERVGCVPPGTCTTACGACETCKDGACVAVTDGESCDDGNACSASDSCQGGICVGGTATACDDGNSCTVDSCDSATGCQHEPVPDETSCGDGKFCNGQETCAAGECRAGDPATLTELKAQALADVRDTEEACTRLDHYKIERACTDSAGVTTQDVTCSGGTGEACDGEGQHGGVLGSYCLLYGPRTFTRHQGRSVRQSSQFWSDAPKAVRLILTNGPVPGDPTSKAAQGASVWLNGVLILDRFRFAGVPAIKRDIVLAAGGNLLEVEIKGQAGSEVIVEITDTGVPVTLSDFSDLTCTDTFAICSLTCTGCAPLSASPGPVSTTKR